MSQGTLEFGLTLRLSGGDRDVAIEARSDASIGELADALAHHAGVAARGVLFSDRAGRLTATDRIGRADLHEGDVVSLDGPVAPRTESPRGTTGPVMTLAVTGGPAAGQRVALGPGRYVVGRQDGIDIPIADPSLSRQHFAIEVGRDGTIAVADAGSRNGTAIEGAGLAEGTHPLTPGRTVEAGRSTFAVEPWHPPVARRAHGPAIDFNRSPRVSRGYEPPTLRLEPPPNKLRAFKIPVVVALVPLLMGVVIYLVTKSPIMLLMGAFSPVMMIGSAVSTKRAGAREHDEQVAHFEAQAEELRRGLQAAREHEQQERRAAAPHAADVVARATELRDELWERRPADRDFLDVRVGTADQPSIVQVAFQSGGDPEMRAPIDRLIAAHQEVPVVPVLLRFTDLGAIGIVGDPDGVEGVGRWVMAQHAVLQSPRDVVIAAALSPERAERWRWLSWLPHTRHAASPIDGEHLAVGELASRALLRQIAAIADERREDGERKSARRRTSIVLLVDEDVAPEATVVDGLMQDCADIDIAVVWLGRERRHLPGGCGAIIEAHGDRAVVDVTFTGSGRVVEEASMDALTLGLADAVARSLAPLKDVTAGGAAAAVPRSVSLVEVLDLVQPSAGAIRARWTSREPHALDAVLGIAADGPYALDLRTHGPHALVAGTTGAGKSEFLQSLIVSLAASHPPDRIAFLLVDYKGGAAFKDCARLPHSVGMVTDLDAHQVQRALISLNAELKRREHVLADHGVRDLLELERRDPAAAPPSLVIVIDEFATLAKEVPEFVDGVVGVAQRGRSLGVHVVLATQRPGNAVTDNIRANMSLRVALRVAGQAESDDVIGVPDAARLPRSIPGRALARTSPTDLEQFQAGYVGGLTEAAGSGARVEVRDRTPKPIATTKGGTPILETTTDLELLVAAITEATEAAGIRPPGSPWEPPLPEVLELAALGTPDRPRGPVAVGLIDEPRRQRQVPYELDLARAGSVLVYGGSGAGKTSALRTITCALAQTYTADELHVYGLDFAGLGLRPLEALPHVGSVIPGDDGERITRLIAVLRRAIDDRARRFSAARVSDLDAYNAAQPGAALPRIVVLLDSYAGFVDAYERVDLGALVEAVPRLVADGRAAGIHFIITADRRAAVPTAITSLVSERLVLRMASDDELQMLGVDTRSLKGVKLPPGRGFVADGRDVQLALVGGSPDATEQVAVIEALGVTLGASTTARATPIAALPEDVPAEMLDGMPIAPMVAPFAIDDLDLAPVAVSLEDAHFAVIGPYRSGRSTALHTFAGQLAAATPGLSIHLLAPRRSILPDLEGPWDSIARGMDECEERIRQLADELLGGVAAADGPVLVVIDDAGEFADSGIASTLEMLIKRGRDANLRILASLETGQARHYAAWIKELRKDGRGLLLDPNLDLDGDLLGVRLPRRNSAVFPPGRGFVVADGRVVLAQVARA